MMSQEPTRRRSGLALDDRSLAPVGSKFAIAFVDSSAQWRAFGCKRIRWGALRSEAAGPFWVPRAGPVGPFIPEVGPYLEVIK